MTQPIAIDSSLSASPGPHSPLELSASSVSSIDWSVSSASPTSDQDDSEEDSPYPTTQSTPRQLKGRMNPLTDLCTATASLALSSEEDRSPTTSPKRVRVLSGSTAPTSLVLDDKPDALDSSDDDDGPRTLAASVPNTPAFDRAGKDKESRPRAQTDAAGRMRRGSRKLNLGVLEGTTADELASWVSWVHGCGRVRLARSPSREGRLPCLGRRRLPLFSLVQINASPSPFEPSTPLTATALSAVGSVLDSLPPSSPSGDNTTPRKMSYGFIPGPGIGAH